MSTKSRNLKEYKKLFKPPRHAKNREKYRPETATDNTADNNGQEEASSSSKSTRRMSNEHGLSG